MTAIALPKEAQDVTTKALSIPEQVKTIVITDGESYKNAGVFWKSIRDLRKDVADAFDPIIKKAHDSHKEAINQKKKIDDPLADAEKKTKGLMETYDREQERKRQEEEARLAEIARKEAEERQLQEAIAAELEGDKETAEAIMQEAPVVIPVVIKKEVPKMAGGPVFRTVWKFRIINPAIIPREYMVPDEVKIGGVVRAMKSATKIPGVEAYEERV